jgi:putative heme transporter
MSSVASSIRAVRSRWRPIALLALVAMLIVEIAIAAPYLSQAMASLESPDLRWLALAVVAELMSMGAFARVQRRMLAAGGAEVPMCRMAALTYAANAVSVTFPGGTALSTGYVFKRLRSWGATGPAAGFTILASGVLSTVSFALLAVVCAVLAGNGGLSSVLVLTGAAAVVVAALITRRRHKPDLIIRLADRGLVRVNRIMHRSPESGVAGLHRIARELSAIKPRNRDWVAGFGFAGLNWVADLACLVACCYAVGAGGASLVLVMVAYIAGMSTSGLSLLPGGLGVVDAAMILALTQGGVSTTAATAGVLLYRMISFALVVSLGWLVWAATWLAEHRRAALALVEPPVELAPAPARVPALAAAREGALAFADSTRSDDRVYASVYF